MRSVSLLWFVVMQTGLEGFFDICSYGQEGDVMREGHWANYRTGQIFPVDEHEAFLRTHGNAKKVGVPDRVVRAFGKFEPIEDRDKFLLFVMQNSPLMRIRGHGDFASFEYSSRDRAAPMDIVWSWGRRNAGPYTGLLISNFATGEKTQIMWEQFEKAMEEGGYDAVMRVAKVISNPVRRKVAVELLALSKKLLASLVCLFWMTK